MWKNSDESLGITSKIVHVASIVDKYLGDNNFSNTRSTFRNEASSLFASSSLNQGPKSLLTLEEMLDEYIFLKRQKAILDQGRVTVMREKKRIEIFWQGMQNALNTYNTFQRPPSPNVVATNANFAVVSPPRVCDRTLPGVSSIASIGSAMPKTFNIQLQPKPINANVDSGNISTPMISESDKKRKDTEAVNGSTVTKKRRGRPPGRKNQVQGQNTLPQSSNVVNNQVVSWLSSSATLPSSGNCAPSGSQVQGSNAAKGSFNPPLFFDPNNSQILETPPRTQSSRCDKYVSPTNFLVASCNQDASPSCCTMISTNRVIVGPEKQMAYKESSHCISPIEADTSKASTKDDVRSNLNFDASNMPKSSDKSLANEVSTSKSDKEVDISDIDFSNFDWSFIEISHKDFSLYDLGPTDSNDNASSSRSSHELQVSTDKYLNIQGLDSQHV